VAALSPWWREATTTPANPALRNRREADVEQSNTIQRSQTQIWGKAAARIKSTARPFF
jgi:hypothetical protein